MGNTTSPLSRRDFMRLSAGSTAALALGSCAGTPDPGHTKRPNVLFIFDDQLRADACGVYGGKNISTPHIDRLAAGGATFTNGISPCPVCTPYRGMLQTGRYATHTGIMVNFTEVYPHQRCLAHIFRDAGYRTGFIGKWHLAGGKRKLNGKHFMTRADQARAKKNQVAYARRCPEPEYVPPGPSRLGYDHWEAFNFHVAFRNPYFYRNDPVRLYMDGYETDAEMSMAMDFMGKAQKDGEPFFLMVAPHPPHPPFRPSYCPEGYLDRIPEQLKWAANVPADHKLRKDPLPARCYYAMAKNMDDNLGRILNYLDETGLAENTILVFTSDHGEMLGSHNRMNKMVPYAEATNIPLLIRWPRQIPAGRKIASPHSVLDHMPTLCGLAGLTCPDKIDGADLSRLVRGREERADRESILLANYTSHWDYFDSGTRWPEWRGVRDERHTYAKWYTGKEELYDNLADPGQGKNLAAGLQDERTLHRFRARLKDLLADAHDEFLPGTAYGDWFDDTRNLKRTALGPVRRL